jgi:hypothetical protein
LQGTCDNQRCTDLFFGKVRRRHRESCQELAVILTGSGRKQEKLSRTGRYFDSFKTNALQADKNQFQFSAKPQKSAGMSLSF